MLINAHKVIFTRAESDFSGVFKSVNAMTGLHALDEGLTVRGFVDQINTCLIECYGVKRA